MDGLGKITSFKDIKNLVKTDPVEVSPHKTTKHRSDKHNDKIGVSLKKFNESDEGVKLRKAKSERMRKFYETPYGESIRKKLSKKCGKPKQKAVPKATRKRIVLEYNNGKKIRELAEEYNVSRASIYRYIKEFT